MVMDSQHKVDNINDVQEKLNVYEDNDVLYSSVNTQIDDDSQIKDITLLNYDDYVIDEYGYKVCRLG